MRGGVGPGADAARMPVEELVPHLVARARDEGRLGLAVVLARTAETPWLGVELDRGWAAVRDVAGEALGVLCPGVGTGSGDPWASGRSGLPVSQCTRYFGVPEERLPALLVLCPYEEQDVLVQLGAETGVYELCKQIAVRSGRALRDRELFEERDRLGNRVEWLGRTVESREREREGDRGRREGAWPPPVDPELERDREELAEDRARLEALERRLATRTGLAAAVVDAARAVLGADAVTEPLPRGAESAEGAGNRRLLAVRPAGPPPRDEGAGTETDTGGEAAGDPAGSRAESRADATSPGGTRVHNSVSGATIHGTVVQGGDMGDVTVQPPPRTP